MLQKTLYSISIVIVIGLIFYVNHESDPIMQLTSGDHRDQQSEVIKYLLADWEKPMHSTSIPLAMKNIGIAPDDDLRLKIVQIFRENNELANNIKYYGPNNYLLSNTEKLLAKYLINSYENEKRMPELEELSTALSLSKNAVESRLEFLTNAGLLDQSDDGIRLTDDYKTFGGPLRYNFHRITIDSEKSFDVW